MQFCSNCNVEVDDKFSFCPQCGSRLQSKTESNFCPYCGNRIETEGEFCPFCGKPLIDEQNVITSAPPTINQYNSVNNQYISSNNIPQETPEEESSGSLFVAGLKVILYFIGGFFLLLVMKVLTKGMVKSFMRDGLSLSVVICAIIVGLISYYFISRKSE